MATYYAKRALEILRDEGAVELTKSTNKFIYRQAVFKSDLLWEYEKQKWKNKSENQTDADPFKIVWVEPKQIQYVTGKIEYNYRPDSPHLDHFKPAFSGVDNFGRVRCGDWDTHEDKFTEIWVYKAIEQWYEKDIPWKETDFFNKHLELIEEHGRSYKCESKEELFGKCKRYESILNDIKKNGFKTQREQGNLKPHREITVNIGRNGEFLFFGGGRHRLSIAKVLNLEKVPIIVKVRHRLWQELRDEIHNNGLPETREELRDHPDLQDVLN